MARTVEQKLAAIHAIREAPAGSEALLREALRGKVGLVIAAATKVIAEHRLDALVDELPAAFARLLERPVERDPGCRGKTAIARALHDLDRWHDDVFARAAMHVQREPVWGGSEDTAGELRGIAGLAYAHAAHPHALDVLGELLADPERTARTAAAQALGDAGHPDATALLRHKVIVGDDEEAVLIACFGSLLVLDRERSLAFAARWLGGQDDRSESAAIALGESRLDEAFPLLVSWCDAVPAELRRRIGYLALALMRKEPATAYLVDLVRAGDRPDADAAIRALGAFRYDEALGARVREAASHHPDGAVRAAAGETFAAP